MIAVGVRLDVIRLLRFGMLLHVATRPSAAAAIANTRGFLFAFTPCPVPSNFASAYASEFGNHLWRNEKVSTVHNGPERSVRGRKL